MALDLLGEQVSRCESENISILCCPEAFLGGLADYCDDPVNLAIPTAGGELERILAPLMSHTVTTIVGFTELGPDGSLFNSAAVLRRRELAGVYRKHHPARRASAYSPGRGAGVFQAGSLTFGVVICNDTNFVQPARSMVELGATVLFVPANNALLAGRALVGIVSETRAADIAMAAENRAWVVRADVVGRQGAYVAHGTSGVVNSAGEVVIQANAEPGLFVVDIS